MSWKDSIGQFTSWLGDISGVSDVADEVSLARKHGGISGDEWQSIAWQGFQVPFETAFVAPFKVLGKGAEVYYEDVFRPLMDVAKVGVLGTVGAPVWKKQGETYGQYLSRAWDQREDVSLGEVSMMTQQGLMTKALGATPQFDPMQDRDVDRWRDSPMHWLSGTVDFTKDLVLDPLTYAGTPVKALSAARTGAKIVAADRYAATGFFARKGLVSTEQVPAMIDAGKFDDTLHFWAAETNKTTLASWFQKEMGVVDADAAAYLASRIEDVDSARDLAKVLTLSDREAASRLSQRYGAAYDLTLNHAEHAERALRTAMATGDDVIVDPHLHSLFEGYMAEADNVPEVMAALRRAAEGPKDEAFKRGLDKLTASDAGAAQRIMPGAARAARGGQNRAVRASVGVTREPIVTEYRPSRWHPSMYIVERPSGLVRPEADDAFGEITAQIRELDKLTKGELVRSGLADDVVSRWMAAGTLADPASARGAVAHSLNEIGIGLMKRRYNLSDEMADSLFQHATARSKRLTDTLREKGWLSLVLDNGSMGLLRSPVLGRTTPNAVQLWDFRQIDRTLARYEGTGWEKVIHSAGASGAVDVADLVNTIFKTSVLMRLGYTIRNLTEAGLSIAATGNLGHVMAAVGHERMATLVGEATRKSNRLIDRVATSFYLRDRLDDVEYRVRNLEAQAAAKQAQLDTLAEQIAYTDHKELLANPEYEQIGRQLFELKERIAHEQVTYHGRLGKLGLLEEGRALSTTGIYGAAQRHAEAQAWQPLKVADFSATGGRRGLLSPHPDIDRGYRGGAGPTYHSGGKRAGDHRDPAKRGEVVPFDPAYVSAQNLVGPGLYTTASKDVSRTYLRKADDDGYKPQTYTVLWTGWNPPKLFDADRPWHEIPEAEEFVNTYVDDFMRAAASTSDNFELRQLQRKLDQHRLKALAPGAEAQTPTMRGVLTALEMYARDPDGPSGVNALRTIAKEATATDAQRRLIREAADLMERKADPEDAARLMDRIDAEYPAAYWWNTGVPFEGTYLGELAGTMTKVVEEAMRGRSITPEWDEFLGKYMVGENAEDLRMRWREGGVQRRATNNGYRYSDDELFHMESLTGLQWAFNKFLRDEKGYDAIRHSGGLNGAWNQQHKVTVFLSGKNTRLVGDDWLDYDNAKILEASRAMAIQLRDELRAGARVRRVDRDARPGLGRVSGDHDAVAYSELTLDQVERWISDPVAMARAFKYSTRKKDPLMFERRFEVLPKGVEPNVHEVASYGPTLDLTGRWGDVPDDIRKAMGWTRHHQVGTKKRRGRAFTGDADAIRKGDQQVLDRLKQAAFDLGYARVVVRDNRAFGGRQVLVDPRAVGEAGLKRRVEAEVERVKGGANVAAAPDAEGSTMFSRMQEKAMREKRKGYRVAGNSDPRPVIPGYEHASALGYLNNGLEEAVDTLLSDQAAIQRQLSHANERLTTVRARRDRLDRPLIAQGKGFGQQSFRIRDKWGADYEMAGPFGGHAGTLHARLTSSDDSYHHLVIGTDIATQAGAGMAPVSLSPDNPRYYEGWSNILNMHFRDPESKALDPVVERILGGSSYDDMLDWATGTREGYDWAHAIGLPRSSSAKLSGEAKAAARKEAWDKTGKGSIDPEDIEQAVAGLYRAVDLYLPDGPIRQAYLDGGDLSAEAIRKARQGMDNPTLHALLVPTAKEARMAWAKGDYVRAGATKVMRVLGSMPETAFARHPLYATLYRDEVTRRVQIAAERKGESLTVGELNKIARDSHVSAKRDLEKTLFTVVRRSNASGAVIPRLLFPFASAYENVLRRWGGFVKADPSMPMRAAVLVEKFVANANFISPGGEPIKGTSDLTTDSYLVLPGLQSVGRFVGGKYGKALETQAMNVQIPMASMDVLFQGRPGDPGMGPIGLLPISEVLKRKPSFETFLGWTMPYGVPEDQIDLFLPAWAKRMKSKWSEDGVYANTVAEVYLVEQWKYENGQRPTPPSLKDVTQAADAFFTIRALTNLLSPVSVNYGNERDFYVAKLRALREAYRDEPGGYQKADAEFFLQFPDTQLLVQSLSRNPSGAQATVGAVENLQEYREDVAKAYAMGDPALAGFIANYGSSGQDPFSDAAYEWQKTNASTPGSKDTYRQMANPEEAVREAHVADGWRTWRGLTEQVSARLEASGVVAGSPLHTQYMQQAKARAAEMIVQSGNEDWYYEYINPDTSKYFRRASFFEELVNDSPFASERANDPLMRSIAVYLEKRKQVQQVIDLRVQAGGNKTLTAQSNQDVATAWEAIVARLKADSPEFSEWVDRYMANDPVVMR